MDEYRKIGYDIIGSAFEVRNHTGRGLLEKFYESALIYELTKKGYKVESQVEIPAVYREVVIQEAYRADLIVNNKVIIELKAISQMDSIQSCQLNTYLHLSGYKLGYLINFGAEDFSIGNLNETPPYVKGIYRVVNNI